MYRKVSEQISVRRAVHGHKIFSLCLISKSLIRTVYRAQCCLIALHGCWLERHAENYQWCSYVNIYCVSLALDVCLLEVKVCMIVSFFFHKTFILIYCVHP